MKSSTTTRACTTVTTRIRFAALTFGFQALVPRRSTGIVHPCPILPDVYYDWYFGGPHPGGWIAVFCDNSVRFLSFDMKPVLHQNFGSRYDGRVSDLGSL